MKLLLVLLLATSCTVGQLDFTGLFNNQGVIGKGDNRDNTQTMEIDFKKMDIAGDRVLTKEESEQAKKSYERGLRDAQQNSSFNNFNGVRLHYVAFQTQNLSVDDMLKKFPRMKQAHPDLQYYVTRLYNAHPYFVVGEVQRSKARQRKLKAKGVSFTMNSKHLRSPSDAVDLIPKRGKRPDFNDVDSIFYLQGLGNGIGMVLETLPCDVFGSTIENIFRWQFIGRKIRDGYHHAKGKLRDACKDLL